MPMISQECFEGISLNFAHACTQAQESSDYIFVVKGQRSPQVTSQEHLMGDFLKSGTNGHLAERLLHRTIWEVILRNCLEKGRHFTSQPWPKYATTNVM